MKFEKFFSAKPEKQKEESNDYWDYRALEELKNPTSERCATLMWAEAKVKKFAKINKLDISKLPPPVKGLKTPGRCIVAKKEIIGETLQERIDKTEKEFSEKTQVFSEKLITLYEKIKTMPALKAAKFLLKQPCLKGGLEMPEVAIMEGLLFGYKLCDIDYYLRTRYLENPKHPFEDIGYQKTGAVVCEKCAEKIMEEQKKNNNQDVKKDNGA